LRAKAAVVLIDFRLSDMRGLAAATLIRSQVPDAAIVFHKTPKLRCSMPSTLARSLT
jgi:DNA-binding NarL/FixJ family response regulator